MSLLLINIEIVVDQVPGHVVRQCHSVQQGTSVGDLLQEPFLQTMLQGHHDLRFGVYAKKVGQDYQLQEGDRLEFYRPLLLSPKEARRLRAKKQANKPRSS